jgi:uncharacterized protein
MNMSTVTVTDLLVYPVKSMRGISLRQATLTAKGLANDRRWMVVNADGRFITQKDTASLALVDTALVDDGVELSMPGKGSVHVPFSLHQGQAVETSVWGTRCEALDQGREVSEWLTGALASDNTLRLVRMDPEYRRPGKKTGIMGRGTTTDFADIAPYLLAGEASLEHLNTVLVSGGRQPVPMDRFRPNIVFRGLEAFAEHRLTSLRAPGSELQMRLHCERCVVTTIDQQTARKDPQREPFKTLKKINPVPGEKAGPAFGHYATLLEGQENTISVGDRFQAIF